MPAPDAPSALTPEPSTTPSVVVPDPSSAPLFSMRLSGSDQSESALVLSRISRVLRPWLPNIVTVWCCGVLMFSLRPAWGWHCVRRLLKNGTSPVDREIQNVLNLLCERMRIRQRAIVLASSLVTSPVVVGCLRSVILVPTSLLTSIPAGQLEAILAHELAHVRRWDFVVNLLQSLIETLFFYHPAVWWLSNRIRAERENCCDDLVVAVLGNRIEYGRALLAVEEFRGSAISRLAIGVRDGSLLARVRRLMTHSGNDNQRSYTGFVAGTTLLCGLLAAVLWSISQTRAQESHVRKLPAKRNPPTTVRPQHAVVSTSRGGRWQITKDVELLIEREVFHGADVSTTAVLIWSGSDSISPRSCRIHMAADLFANRNSFTAVWETGRPVLWFASGWPGDKQQGSEQARPKADRIHRLDFSDSNFVVDHRYNGWPAEGRPSDECMSRLNSEFIIEPNGEETFRCYQTSLPGNDHSQSDNHAIYVSLYAEGHCRVSNPRPTPPEIRCTLATLTQTLNPIVLHKRSLNLAQLNPPLHVVVGAAPDYPEVDLRAAFAACKAAEVLVPQRSDEIQAQLPWRAIGRVTDSDSKPLAGVTVRAATGIGTLRGGGSGITDENGRYDFRFGMGIQMAAGDDGKPSPQTQAAIIFAHIDGYFEETLCQQGNGIASLEPVSDDEMRRRGITPEQVCLPDRPREVNFVMLPAARVSGTLVGEDDQPLKDYSVSLIGEKLPPGSSALTQVWTDSNGRFEITEIPTNAAFQIEIRKPHAELGPPWNDSWATGPVKFTIPGDNDLATTSDEPDRKLFTGAVAKRFRIRISGPGVHGKTALARGVDNVQTESMTGSSADESGRLVISELTLILSNELPDGAQAAVKPVSPAPTKTLADSLNVMSVGFDMDGKLWSIAARQKVTVRRWDAESGEKLSDTELETNKHANQYLSGELQFSDDRARILAIDEGKIAVWDSVTGKRIATLEPPAGNGAHRGLSYSHDRSRIACGLMQSGGRLNRDSQAVVWDANSGERVCSVTHPGGVQIHCTAISPDCRWLATGSQETGLCIWDVSSGELKHLIANENPGRRHPDSEVELRAASQVLSVCFSPDSKRLAMSDLLSVKVFDTESGQLLIEFERPFRFGRCGLVFSADSNLLARVSTDQTICLWNLQTGQLIAELRSESHSGSFSNNGNWFATGFTDESNGIRLWHLANGLPQ